MVEGYSNADWIAQGPTLEGSHGSVQLFTAEDDIKTGPGTYAAGQQIAVLTILARNAAGNLVPWDPAAVDDAASEARVVGVAAVDVDTTATGYNGVATDEYYISACFNPALLVWPESLEDAPFLERQAALEAAGAPFRTKHLL